MGINTMSSIYSSREDQINYIDRIEFGIYGSKEVKSNSSVIKEEYGINLPETYENGEPKRGGLNDDRLGITDNGFECSYCGLGIELCQGHFGHIEFADYVFHSGFLPFIKNILSCICLRSSKLLTYKNEKAIAKIVAN